METETNQNAAPRPEEGDTNSAEAIVHAAAATAVAAETGIFDEVWERNVTDYGQ